VYGRGVGTSFHLARCGVVPSTIMAYLSRQWAVPIATGYAAGCFTAVNVRRRIDPWEDTKAHAFIRGHLVQTDVFKERWAQLHHTCRSFVDRKGQIWFRADHSGLLKVPPPDQRSVVVLLAHADNGHLGRDRTHAMVTQNYYWSGMWSTVAQALKTCSQCDRVRASFDRKVNVMQPLPLMGLFYKFLVDVAVMLPTSAYGFKHVLVIVEALS